MMIPAILAWLFSNVAWLGLMLVIFQYDALTLWAIGQYAVLLMAGFFVVPIITKTLYAYMSGRRMWSWGRSRFYNKRHMAHWMGAVGNNTFELVVQVDEKLKQEGQFIKLMRP